MVARKLWNMGMPWAICGLAALFYCYEFVLRVAPGIVAHEIMRDYQIGAAEFGVFSVFYLYAYTPMQMVVGILMDHYGPRRLLSLAILTCMLGCFILAGTHTLWVGKCGLLLIGFGSAFAFVGVLKLAVNWLPEERLGLIAGLTTGLGLLGGKVAGPLLLMIVHQTGWRDAWWYSGVFGVLILISTFFLIRDYPSDLQMGQPKKSNISWRVLFHELSHMLKDYRFMINGFIGCVLYFPVSVFAGLWGISFLEAAGFNARGLAADTVAWIYLGMALGGPMGAVISEWLGRRRIMYQAAIVLATLVLGIVIFCPMISAFWMSVLLFGLGLAIGSQILVFVVGVELSKKDAAGTSTACTNFLVMLGAMIMQPVVGYLVEWHWSGVRAQGLPVYTMGDYQFALSIILVCFIIALFGSFWLPETHPKVTGQHLQ
jgi:sugar phosphate permease